MITQGQIEAAIHELGLAGQPICLHASLRSFGWVDGGAQSVIDGLLAADCTILVPTFSDEYAVAPLPTMQRPRNGTDYVWAMQQSWPGVNKIYTPESNALEVAEMGVIPQTVLQMEGRQRGNHPLCSFAAIGPQAEELIIAQSPLAVNAPLTTLVALGGTVLLTGVGLASMTLLHLAEEEAGRNLFRRWARDHTGRTIEVEMGGCSDGFESLAPILAPFERWIMVGSSQWRSYPAAETVAAAAAAIRRDPMITHCGKSPCRCDDAILGGPILSGAVNSHHQASLPD